MRFSNPIPPAVQGWKDNIAEPLDQRYECFADKINDLMDNCNFLDIQWFGGRHYEAGPPMASYPPEFIVENCETAREASSNSEDSQSSIDVEAGLGDNETPQGIELTSRYETPTDSDETRRGSFHIKPEEVPLPPESDTEGSSIEAEQGSVAPDLNTITPTNKNFVASVKMLSPTRSFQSLKRAAQSGTSKWRAALAIRRESARMKWATIQRDWKSKRTIKAHASPNLSAVSTFFFIVGKMMGVAIIPMIGCFEKLGVTVGIFVTIIAMTVSGVATRCMWQFILRHPQLKNIADVTAQLFHACFGLARTGFYLGWGEYFAYNLLIMAVHVKFGSNAIHYHIGDKVPLGFWTSDTVTCLALSLMCAGLSFLPRKFISKMGAFSGMLTLSFLFVFFCVLFVEGPVELRAQEIAESEVRREAIHLGYNPESSQIEKMTSVLKIQFATLVASSVPMLMADMAQPKDFPKAVVGHKIILTSVLVLFGAGPCFTITPQHAALEPWNMIPQPWGRVTASLLLVPGVLQGMIYGIVNAQPLMKTFGNGERAGMTLRNAIVTGVVWLLAWLITQAAPGLASLMCIIGGVFGCAFGALTPAFVKIAMLTTEAKKHTAAYLKRARGLRKIVVIVWLLGAAGFLIYASKSAVESFTTFVEDTRFIPFEPMPSKAATTSDAFAFPTATAEETPTGTRYVSEETEADYYGR